MSGVHIAMCAIVDKAYVQLAPWSRCLDEDS